MSEDSPFEAVEDDAQLGETPGDTATTAEGPLGRLFDGNAAGPSVQELQGDYNLPWHWATALRGTCRTMTGSGVPPAFEILIGGGVGVAEQLNGEGMDSEPGTGMETPDMDGGENTDGDRPWSKS